MPAATFIGLHSCHMRVSTVCRGKWKYSDYRKKVIVPEIGDATAPAVAPPPPQQQLQPVATNGNGVAVLPRVPDDLVGVQAYVLWERAGRPDGADFSVDARRCVEAAVLKGSVVRGREIVADWTIFRRGATTMLHQ